MGDSVGLKVNKAAEVIIRNLYMAGYEAYLVGGYVRDIVMDIARNWVCMPTRV